MNDFMLHYFDSKNPVNKCLTEFDSGECCYL